MDTSVIVGTISAIVVGFVLFFTKRNINKNEKRDNDIACLRQEVRMIKKALALVLGQIDRQTESAHPGVESDLKSMVKELLSEKDEV